MPAPVRRHSAAAERNRQPLLDVLRQHLPPTGLALEIASGTGQHVAWFAAHLPAWRWQPTEADPAAFDSIAAWCGSDGAAGEADAARPLANVEPPLQLDVCAAPWPLGESRFDAVLCANMLHIAPWTCCAALMQGAARHLTRHGLLIVYGPFSVEGEPLAPGNVAFDADLRARDPAWGLRSLQAVSAEAARAGLSLRGRHAMPANNLTLVFSPT